MCCPAAARSSRARADDPRRGAGPRGGQDPRRGDAWRSRRTPMNLRYYAGEALRTDRRDVPHGRRQPRLHRRASRSASSPRSRPWNFPLNIPSRKLGPALAAGNGVVFKPSELTPADRPAARRGAAGGRAAGRCARRSSTATPRWARRSCPTTRVDAVTFTGSTDVGEAIHRNVAPSARAPSSRWAARTRWSCWTTPTSTRRPTSVAKGAFGLSGQACTGTSRA